MTKRKFTLPPFLALFLFTAIARAQDLPQNIDRALDSPITLNAAGMPLSEFADLLRTTTRTNIVINWNALAQTGIDRKTPVDLHLKDLPYEQVVRTLIEILPATHGRASYAVSGNTLTITTESALSRDELPVLTGFARAVTYTLGDAPSPEQQAQNAKLLATVLRAYLARAGEPLDGKTHILAIKGQTLAGTLSERGKGLLDKAIAMINAPTRPGQLSPGSQLTAAAKKTLELLHNGPDPSADNPEKQRLLNDLATTAADHPRELNIALLPGTLDATPPPAAPALDFSITDGGVLLIGPAPAIESRTLLAVYDLQPMIKRTLARNNRKPGPSAADLQAAFVKSLQDRVRGQPYWGNLDDLDKKPACMIPYNGLLIVFATPQTQRDITAALQDFSK